jgi:predicted transcriptional regulator
MGSKPKNTDTTKLKHFIYSNGITPEVLSLATKEVDIDGFGLSEHHIRQIANKHINPTVSTIVIICNALSRTLNKRITPNDVIDFQT